MRTLSELKTAIGYQQTDACFLDYLNTLSSEGLITPGDGDILLSGDHYSVSESFFYVICQIYGIQPDDELHPVLQEDADESGIR
ncbi:TPA: hypothetical protein R1B10_001117 [Klebsiella pneumoniae]|nr:hypothetical protein [Klebsiella pneumoniae]HCB0080079.1 hypothetical protein [Klebsiella pneumoniae]HEB5772904.1 hypothetical protein [Klebsiella pneumoniae]HEB9059497.1 hypothetical protein [Klebsiella pneumoniae]HEB9065118.1 hypothetical protein [Klebsiella pneumoniae]